MLFISKIAKSDEEIVFSVNVGQLSEVVIDMNFKLPNGGSSTVSHENPLPAKEIQYLLISKIFGGQDLLRLRLARSGT